jgi:hypothetical protein
MKIQIADDKTVIEFEAAESLKLLDPANPQGLTLLIETIAKLREDKVISEIAIQAEKAKLDLEIAEKLKALDSNKTA